MIAEIIESGLCAASPAPTIEPWVGQQEVRRHMGGIGETTLRLWMREGLPHFRKGNVLLFKLSQVEAWAQTNMKTEAA